MTDGELPTDPPTIPHFLNFAKAVMGGLIAYSGAAIIEISTSGVSSTQLQISAACFIISLAIAISQIGVMHEAQFMGEEDEYAELFVSSWKFVGAFLAPLVAAILGTAALLAHVALWLVIPFAISFVFLWIFVRNQEKAMKQLRNKNRPYLDDNKD